MALANEIYYSTAANRKFNFTNKLAAYPVEVWQSSANLTVGRYYPAGAGTQNAPLIFGGFTGSDSSVAEKLHGNTWVATGSLGTVRRAHGGSGIQNSAVAAAGINAGTLTSTEKFNGTLWSATGSVNTGRYSFGCTGITNASLLAGGIGISSAEKFNGTTWSNTGSLSGARGYNRLFGTQNSGMHAGGFDSGVRYATCEFFNGSNWASAPTMSIARVDGSTVGTFYNGLAATGTIGASAVISSFSEKFNGVSWSTTVPALKIRSSAGSAGTGGMAILAGGESAADQYMATSDKYTRSPAVKLNMLFKGEGAVGTTDLVTNGTFNTNLTGWTANGSIIATWSSPGYANIARNGSSSAFYQTITTVPGVYYKISWDVLSTVAAGGTLEFWVKNGTDPLSGTTLGSYSTITSAGTYAVVFRAESTQATLRFYLETQAAAVAQLDNISVVTQSFAQFIEPASSFFSDQKGYFVFDVVLDEKKSGEPDALDVFSLGRHNNPNLGVWTSSGALNTARDLLGGAGFKSAALAFGGQVGVSASAITETFNGASWSNASNLNTARQRLSGCGLQSSAISFGGNSGSISAVTEKFNGSVWSAASALNTAIEYNSGAGIASAALSYGGINAGSLRVATSEKYNGATWSTTGSLSAVRSELGVIGAQNAALAAGGSNDSVPISSVEIFNGSTWVSSVSLNVAKFALAGSGTSGAAMVMGGYISGELNAVDVFNGSAWMGVGLLNTARHYLAAAGSNNAAVSFGGKDGVGLAVSETYRVILPAVDFSAAGSWSPTAVYPSIIQSPAVFGSANDAVSAGGYISATTANAHKFNGSTWTTTGSLGSARTYAMGAGTSSAGVVAGGSTAGGAGAVVTTAETFNGSAFSSTGGLNTARFTHGLTGIQSAAILFGGVNSASTTLSSAETFNGSAWSVSGASLATARASLMGFGVQSSTIAVGGYTSFGTYNTNVVNAEYYNGSTWATTTAFPFKNSTGSAVGVYNNGMVMGGRDSGSTRSNLSLKFNGSIWSSAAYITSAKQFGQSAGSNTSGLLVGGDTAGTSLNVVDRYSNTATTPAFAKYVIT